VVISTRNVRTVFPAFYPSPGLHIYDVFSHVPALQASVDEASTHFDPAMQYLQLLPERQDAQLVCCEQLLPPVGPPQPAAVTVHSVALHCPGWGSLAFAKKHELLLLHQPHPEMAVQAPQSGVSTAQSA
jgi:hypothetical protein